MPSAPDLSGIALNGRYELHALIGEGAFGRVYRGRDRRLARPVAVKVIKPWWAEDPEWVRSFEREAQLLAAVSDPGIVQIFDVGSAREGLFYVAELVDGESLAARLRSGPLSAPEARDVAEQLARALSSAHARGVVHRDVKPANVLISRDGRIKVGDFGVAHLSEGTSDHGVATIAGTPRYMAPEQARGEAGTPATDVYGVGIVLYEMLAGHPPFDGRSPVELAFKHVNDAPPPLPAGTPPALIGIVSRALAKDPAERYSGGGELADALRRARASLLLADGADSGGGLWSARGGTATLQRPDRPATRARPAARPRAAIAEPTVLGEPMSPRRNVNPPARRRRAAIVGAVLLLAAGMLTGALVLAPGHLTVPNLHGLSRSRVLAKAHALDFQPAISSRYSSARPGNVIVQAPDPGTRIEDGSAVAVVLSAGPPPVPVPKLTGVRLSTAQTMLSTLKLRSKVAYVPAPGTAPGTVTGQSARIGAEKPRGSTIMLSVAEQPQLRALTGVSGTGSGSSVAFRIRGVRWELFTTMSYQGTCTFVFWCSGPDAKVINTSTGATVDHFSLNDGSGSRIITAGPGLYRVDVSPGSDTARWAVKVDDYY